jgi:hypothetical protein
VVISVDLGIAIDGDVVTVLGSGEQMLVFVLGEVLGRPPLGRAMEP